jgi:flagellar capping protein FliD
MGTSSLDEAIKVQNTMHAKIGRMRNQINILTKKLKQQNKQIASMQKSLVKFRNLYIGTNGHT